VKNSSQPGFPAASALSSAEDQMLLHDRGETQAGYTLILKLHQGKAYIALIMLKGNFPASSSSQRFFLLPW
jgi:hypothetical protein